MLGCSSLFCLPKRILHNVWMLRRPPRCIPLYEHLPLEKIFLLEVSLWGLGSSFLSLRQQVSSHRQCHHILLLFAVIPGYSLDLLSIPRQEKIHGQILEETEIFPFDWATYRARNLLALHSSRGHKCLQSYRDHWQKGVAVLVQHRQFDHGALRHHSHYSCVDLARETHELQELLQVWRAIQIWWRWRYGWAKSGRCLRIQIRRRSDGPYLRERRHVPAWRWR